MSTQTYRLRRDHLDLYPHLDRELRATGKVAGDGRLEIVAVGLKPSVAYQRDANGDQILWISPDALEIAAS